jgi:hypothetical protein
MLKRENKEEKIVRLVDFVLYLVSWSDLWKKKQMRNIYREKICFDIWDKYVALYFVVFFFVRSLSKDAIYWLLQKYWFLQVMKEDFILER